MHCVCVLECERLQRQLADATTQLSECRDQLATCRSQSADQQKRYDDLIVTRDETVHQLRDDSSRLQKRVNTASLPLARYIMLLLFATFCCLQPAVCLHRFGFVFCRQLLMWPTTVLYPLDRELQLRVQFLLRIFIAFLFRCGNICLESRGSGSVWEVAALQSLLVVNASAYYSSLVSCDFFLCSCCNSVVDWRRWKSCNSRRSRWRRALKHRSEKGFSMISECWRTSCRIETEFVSCRLSVILPDSAFGPISTYYCYNFFNPR